MVGFKKRFVLSSPSVRLSVFARFTSSMDTGETVFNLGSFYSKSLGQSNYLFAVLYLRDLRPF